MPRTRISDVHERASAFARVFLDFQALPYQAKLLDEKSKRIAVRMCRQAGKTTCIAIRAIWFAATRRKTLTLIVAPSLRQSMIMMDRVQGFLMAIPRRVRRRLVAKMQRTVIWFRNGSQIVALPNSPHLLRGFTAHQVICDEGSFFKEDELVFYNVLYPMLATTDGTLIVSSTPWGKKSVFYEMCKDPDFKQFHVSYEKVVKTGLIKQSFVDEMKESLPPERFTREFEAEFIDDIDSYLPHDLIMACIDGTIELLPFEAQAQGNFICGMDFGKKVDYSVVAVLDQQDAQLRLVHLHRFPRETAYASVIGYVKALSDRYRAVSRVLCDQTGVGEYIVEDMRSGGIANVNGITFTLPRKEEILGYLKQTMAGKRLAIPYDRELIAEMNEQKFEATKDGHLRFSHPENSHDDQLWALALAVYAARGMAAGKIVPVKRRE